MWLYVADCKTIKKPGLETPNPGESCIFPYTFDGKEYQRCVFVEELNDFLCGTKYDVTYDDGWGICNDYCPKQGRSSQLTRETNSYLETYWLLLFYS